MSLQREFEVGGVGEGSNWDNLSIFLLAVLLPDTISGPLVSLSRNRSIRFPELSYSLSNPVE